MADEALVRAVWRKSSFSGGGGVGGGNCVEVAHLANGRVAVRDSKNPDAGVLSFSRAEFTSWIARLKTS
ncbi:DUF397 domain-containing protein [Saccharopolyspora indica]|uniref:DUF397 domain-containing protein n=1 Tax=Saccharopolyspora indica TaxID=1229659 RepID=UPI0022EA5740|nr:DUF397 domain-containing protein [Saccharopolyspora indica]MDA3643720.1 DUF397 domain-containing protein [Saccharopolyspora indica]